MADLDIAAWKLAKATQFERALEAHPGLTLVRYGKAGLIYMLVKSTDTFYEGVVFGQPPMRVPVVERAGRRAHTRDALEHEKPVEKRAVDLSDSEIDQILALWAQEKTARDLPFVSGVYGRDGKRQA